MPAVPKSIDALQPLTPPPVPIAKDERKARIEKARKLMAARHLDAIFMEGGTSLLLLHGDPLGPERAHLRRRHPARAARSPACARDSKRTRASELIQFGTDVRAWQEDESPFKLVAGDPAATAAVATGRVGIEERVRFFIADGIHHAAPAHRSRRAPTPVTAGCRMIKSPAEIALMQRANDITIAAYKAAWQTLREGMPQDELARNITAAFTAARRPTAT